jgi:hypothetical protein
MKSNVFYTYDHLVKQADVLQEVSIDIPASTVDRVQVAISEDILFFDMVCNGETSPQMLEKFLSGKIDIRAGTIEAARILVNLVLGEPL